jgi:integrase
VLPEFGAVKLSELSRADLQRFAGRLLAEGLSPSTIRNTFLPLRAIYRDAEAQGDVLVSPTTGLQLPAGRGRRDRIADSAEASKLLAVLPQSDRVLWATAFYAGLRLGELRALAWEHVDLAAGVIRVERALDPREGYVEPKSRAGRRRVPIPGVLRDELVEHRMREGRSEGLALAGRGSFPSAPPRSLAEVALVRPIIGATGAVVDDPRPRAVR